MAVDCFLKIDGVPGESADEKHKDWIEVLSFSHGVAATSSAASRLPTGKIRHQDFTVVKAVDKASPLLVHRLSSSAQGGKGLPLEEVIFNYGTITWRHTETDHKTGKPKGQVMYMDTMHQEA
jgi:type VI secretion system secreted protein Hcp